MDPARGGDSTWGILGDPGGSARDAWSACAFRPVCLNKAPSVRCIWLAAIWIPANGPTDSGESALWPCKRARAFKLARPVAVIPLGGPYRARRGPPRYASSVARHACHFGTNLLATSYTCRMWAPFGCTPPETQLCEYVVEKAIFWKVRYWVHIFFLSLSPSG